MGACADCLAFLAAAAPFAGAARLPEAVPTAFRAAFVQLATSAFWASVKRKENEPKICKSARLMSELSLTLAAVSLVCLLGYLVYMFICLHRYTFPYLSTGPNSPHLGAIGMSIHPGRSAGSTALPQHRLGQPKRGIRSLSYPMRSHACAMQACPTAEAESLTTISGVAGIGSPMHGRRKEDWHMGNAESSFLRIGRSAWRATRRTNYS